MGRVPFHLERIKQSQFRSVNTKEKNCDCSVECFQLQKEKYTGARKGGRSESICRERSKQEFDNELSSRLYDAQIRLFIWKPGTKTTCPPKSSPASSDPVQGILHTTFKKLCSHQILFQKSEAEGASHVLFTAFSPELEHSGGTLLQNCRVD